MLKKLLHVFLLVGLITGSVGACGGAEDVRIAEKGVLPETPATDHSPQSPSEPVKPNTGGDPSTSPSPISSKPDMLLISGETALDQGLYTLSSQAREASPTFFGNYRKTSFISPIPLPGPGQVIAVTKEEFGSAGYTLQLINILNGRLYPLFATKDDRVIVDPFVSKDGKWAAFTVGKAISKRQGQIYLVNLNLADLAKEYVLEVPTVSAKDSHPSFSGDGKTLYFERVTATESVIVALSFAAADGKFGSASRVVSGSMEDDIGDFSPALDQKSYFYTKQTGRLRALILHRPDKVDRVISANNESVFEPSWAADQKQILYWGETPSARNIRIYDVAGGATTILADIKAPQVPMDRPAQRRSPRICPAFSSDQNEIYYSSGNDYFSSIYKVAVSSRIVTKLSDSTYTASFFCPRVMPYFEENTR